MRLVLVKHKRNTAEFCPALLRLLDAFTFAILIMRTRYAHKIDGVNFMPQLYNENAPKKATNLSINSDLLLRARRLKINLSATLEHALEDELRRAERDNWLKNNKKAINELNELANNNGLFSDAYRDF